MITTGLQVDRKMLLREGALVFGVLTGLLCLSFWRYLLPAANAASEYFRCDYWASQYPVALSGRQAIFDHRLPLWEPYSSLGGRPAMVEAIRGYLYIPNLLTYAIGAMLRPEAFQTLWIVRVLANVAAGGTAVYLLMRRWGYQWVSGLMSAVLFCFAAFQQASLHLANFTDGFAFIPLVLLLWQWTRSRFSFSRVTILAVALAQLLCSSYQNLYIYAFMLVVLTEFADVAITPAPWSARLLMFSKHAAIGAGVFACGALIALVQVLPTLSGIGASYRSGTHGLEWSVAYQRMPWQGFELLWPDFFSTPTNIPLFWKFQNVTLYVGLLPLFLIPLLFLGRGGEQHGKAGVRWLLITLPFALLAFAAETRLHDLVYLTTPLYGYFRASNNAWAVAMLGFAILSGISLDRIVASRGRSASTGRIVQTAIGVVAVCLIVVVPVALIYASAYPTTGSTFGAQLANAQVFAQGAFEHLLGQIARQLFWCAVVAGGLLSIRRYPQAASLMLVTVAFLEMSGRLGDKLLCNHSTVSPAVIYDNNRLMAAVQELVATETQPVRVRFANDMPQHWASEHFKVFTTAGATTIDTPQDRDTAFLHNQPAHPFANIRYEVTNQPIAGRTPIRELVITPEEAQRRVFADFNAPDGPGLWPRKAGDRLFIYKNDVVMPRAFFVRSLRPVTAATLEQSFASTDLRSTALVAPGDLPHGLALDSYGGASDEATSIVYDTNSVAIDVRAPHDGFLIVSDTFAPGWRAYGDGLELPLFRVNGKFRAIAVRAGTARVSLRYMPPGLITGAAISFLTLALLGALAVRERRREVQDGGSAA